ncbi:hypothetical protein Tco_0799291 [Tanacetum coccineum]
MDEQGRRSKRRKTRRRRRIFVGALRDDEQIWGGLRFGSDRSFVDTRFSSMLDIKPIKIGASYEVELADGRVVSTSTVLNGCALNLVNHIFEIDLMPIELGTFDVIIGKITVVILVRDKCPRGKVDLIGDEDSTNEDGDIGVSVSLGGEIFSEGKESRESNIGDSDNTRDGGKTTGEKTSMSKRYLVKSSEDSGETFLGEAGK